MTTIAAKKLPSGKVQIAWDAQATAGNISSKDIIKVRKINDQFAVGCAGRVRFSNIVHRASVERIHKADLVDPDFDAEGWIIDVLVPSWGKALQKGAEIDIEGEAADGEALVVLCGKIFKVSWDFAVMNMGESTAIGSGCDFAKTAMHLGKTPRKAVEIASELDLYTGGTIKELTL